MTDKTSNDGLPHKFKDMGDGSFADITYAVQAPADYLQRAADGVIRAAPCIVYGVICIASGTAALYDNASAGTGTKIYEKAMTAGDVVLFGPGIRATAGCYLDLTGGTFNVITSLVAAV